MSFPFAAESVFEAYLSSNMISNLLAQLTLAHGGSCTVHVAAFHVAAFHVANSSERLSARSESLKSPDPAQTPH